MRRSLEIHDLNLTGNIDHTYVSGNYVDGTWSHHHNIISILLSLITFNGNNKYSFIDFGSINQVSCFTNRISNVNVFADAGAQVRVRGGRVEWPLRA